VPAAAEGWHADPAISLPAPQQHVHLSARVMQAGSAVVRPCLPITC
jgi:hypothetical protein